MATDKNGPRPARKRAAPAAKKTAAPPAKHVGERFARTTAPRELDDPGRREKWGLPPLDRPDEPGPYVIELNAQHLSGLQGAASAFLALYRELVLPSRAPAGDPPPAGSGATEAGPEPVRIAKSYYWALLSDNEWRALVSTDEAKPLRGRAIYRLWPDFPVGPHTDRSISTIKADAALRSFDAAGEKITWAVIDSGIDADHPHFGLPADGEERHALRSPEVVALHRCFADVREERGGVMVVRPPLADPDADAAIPPEERRRLIAEHGRYALRDDFGHGTHVAGIIAGQAPRQGPKVVVLEHQYRMDEDGRTVARSFSRRECEEYGPRPRGVAPRCKLISLRVLDHEGKGRASRVIQALEYIRERINDNPKLMRVHGVNLSVGYEFDAEMFACGQSPLCSAVDRLVQEGIVVVAAAGNTGYGTAAADVGAAKMCLSNSINDPGNAAAAITVGSTHRDAPHTYGVSYFSSKGPTGDGRIKPDLVAPGERIVSCAAGRKLAEARPDGGGDGGQSAYYVDDSGTSMAAPHVSGAIAAFLSIRREFVGKPQEVKRVFLDSATPLGRERYFEGRGLVDLMRAIQSV